MPIYAYKCTSCGFAKDVLQKMSDSPLADCPACGVSTLKKQLTAAGFQLKGSGWYATDFKGGASAAASTSTNSESPASVAAEGGKPAENSVAKPDPITPPATGGCGGACACH